MPLIRVPQPFDDPEWVFELKHDGFRCVAVVEGHSCTLVSRRGHVFRQWPQLAEELAHSVRASRAVLDGEVCCLRPDGRSDFNALLFRREWPYFYAFDLLSLEGRDLRGLPLIERKRQLRRIVPRVAGYRLRFGEFLVARGCDLFRLACGHDAEGIVAKWARGCYHGDGSTTSWFKIKNPSYSQLVDRHELFASRRSGRTRSSGKPYRLDPAAPRAACPSAMIWR
jgi:bifunctional non-homologous end joining protein LigD